MSKSNRPLPAMTRRRPGRVFIRVFIASHRYFIPLCGFMLPVKRMYSSGRSSGWGFTRESMSYAPSLDTETSLSWRPYTLTNSSLREELSTMKWSTAWKATLRCIRLRSPRSLEWGRGSCMVITIFPLRA